MKKTLLLLFGILLTVQLRAQEVYHDSVALAILDRVGEYFGELNSLKFKTHTSEDVAFAGDFLIKEFKSGEFIFQDSNRMAGKITKHDAEYWFHYNGSQVVYYSLKGNYFVAADAPGTTLEMLDWMEEDFGITLVMADFLYPTFTQDAINSMEYIEYLGQAVVDGKKAFHVGGANEKMTFQLWVSQDLGIKPIKAVLTYLGDPYARQIEVSFDGWEINETYPNSIFEFTPPPSAKQMVWTKKAD